MEEKLDNGEYRTFSEFKTDFKLIVNNCRLYNGQNNGNFKLFTIKNAKKTYMTFLYIYSFLSVSRIHFNGQQSSNCIRSWQKKVL